VPADAKKLYYKLQDRTPFHPLRVGNAGDDSSVAKSLQELPQELSFRNSQSWF